jgi:hypothetical protein
MTAPSMNLMKDIVRVACNEITQGGKVSVNLISCPTSEISKKSILLFIFVVVLEECVSKLISRILTI